MTIRTLDLYCGGGAGSWGAQLGGASIVCGVDAWQLAIDTFKSNYEEAYAKCIRIDDNSSPAELGDLGNIDLVLASPECTNHTHAKGANRTDETSRATATHSLKFIRELEPRWVVMENVIQMRAWHRYDYLISTLGELGYRPKEITLDASNFGVPQRRRRLFIVGDRKSSPPEMDLADGSPLKTANSILDPEGTWASRPLYSEGRAKPTLERAERAIFALGRGIPFLIVYYGSDGSGGWQRLDKPLRTITTLDRFGLVEWDGSTPMLRMLQVPELMRAMGLDGGYKLPWGTRRDRIKLLGNGICAPVMKYVVETLTGGTPKITKSTISEAA